MTAPTATSMVMYLGFGLGLFASFDVFWFLRLIYTRLSAYVKRPLSIQNGDDSVIYSFCSTTDVDYFCHMNNGRYMREMDFGRFDYYFRSGLASYFARHRDIYVVQHASMIRYRRSLDFLMPYRLHTKLVWFDDRSLYFEQRFVSVRDDFVRAVALSKNTAVNCDVRRMLLDVFGLKQQPECPEHIKHFILSNDLSSRDLRNEAEAGGNLVPNVSFANLETPATTKS